jgi:8-oxo-dGTP pyrophosphatase MutT (NUDIX family)/GNAT superfamily N-acetyltransferase
VIRPAEPQDRPVLDDLERAADVLFDGVVALPSGSPRTAHLALPGFVLVAENDGRTVGFAHVLDFDGRFHLEQLSVHPDVQRNGIGAALLTAVEEAVREAGASVLTLRTFADVPWNAPFYRRHGYADAELPVALLGLLEAEQALGLSLDTRVTLAKQVGTHLRPRPAVSVLPLRDAPDGLQVFVQFRATTMDFAAGAVVFPGGRVDVDERPVNVPADLEAAWAYTDLPDARLLAAAAIREVTEECGVVLAAEELIPWDDWITPPGGRRRFDVAFYLTAARDGQHWRNTTTEAVDAGWRRPGVLLREAAAGGIRLMPPTLVLLRELAGFTDVATAVSAVRRIEPVLDDARRPLESKS